MMHERVRREERKDHRVDPWDANDIQKTNEMHVTPIEVVQ